MIKLIQGDCLEQMKTLEDNSVDSIVSDPPYGISFMAKKWDYDVPSVEVWKEAMRVLKPGGHALIACGTRTQHRMVCNIEDAGFEIRDVVSWIYGSGFPKSLNIGKAIDKARTEDNEPSARVAAWLNSFAPDGWNMNTWRKHLNAEIVGVEHGGGSAQGWTTESIDGQVKPRVATVEQWRAIKDLLSLPDDMDKEVWRLNGNKGQPGENFKSHEVVGTRKQRANNANTSNAAMNASAGEVEQITTPATEAAKQWDGWGTALKPSSEFFTLCRKPLSEKTIAANVLKWGTGGINIDACRVGTESTGRFPANLIHDGSEEVLGLFPDSGDKSPARFFYCPKASKTDRNEGCESLDDKFRACLAGSDRETNGILDDVSERFRTKPAKNNHPTVKPTALMAYLCRLITPPGGVVLDPYMGSGSTGKAAIKEGFGFVGVELDPGYHEIAKSRVVVS